jgi:glycosyltransferase involved in cell wall biosynthesis
MDGRVLINHSHGNSLGDIMELAGWTPEPPLLHSAGTVSTIEPVSLIIPTFFNAELKRRSLRYLLAGLEQCESVREIILVSSDGEKQDFSDLQRCANERPIKIVEADPHNRGKSRNAGAAAATSPNLLFLDDDMLLRNWRGVDVILSHLQATGQDCALFPRRQYAKFPLLFDPYTLQQVIALWRERGEASGSPFLYDPLAEGAPDLPMLFCFPGCFMIIRRDAYERLNGFPEDFVGWGFEDTDFAARAMRELNVLNLFRTGEPLLHIDHPVSPYKSDEHNANYKKFYACTESPDINLFCRRVFRGTDFSPSDAALDNRAAWINPLRQLARWGIPLGIPQVEPWWMRVARQRLSRHLGPLPRFIVLHGSRAEGTARENDDHDVLSLYDGNIQEFFVSKFPRVEMECAALGRFEHTAAHPSIHSFTGPMELAKVARARLLWGSRVAWPQWSGHWLKVAMANGWAFWLVLGLGLRRHSAKYGPMADRYFRSLGKLRAHATAAGEFQVNGEGDFSDEAALAVAAIHALDQFQPDWRERVRTGDAVFELQVPEVWTALHHLLDWPQRLELRQVDRAERRPHRRRLVQTPRPIGIVV